MYCDAVENGIERGDRERRMKVLVACEESQTVCAADKRIAELEAERNNSENPNS